MRSRIRSTLRSIFVDDLGLKLVSLVAAIALFSVVHGAEDAQKSMYVDVISTLPDAARGKMLISEIPVRVRVTLSGSPAQLNGVRQGDVPPIELDLRDTRRTSYEISPADVDLPAGITVTAIDPASIPLDWVERRERRVRVRPPVVGRLRPGLMLAQPIHVEPEVISIVGPRAEVDSLEYVETSEIDLAGVGDGRSERRVRLVHLPEHVMVGGDASVSVTIEVVPERAERTINHVAVGTVGVTARSVRPGFVNVTLFGPPAVVQGLDVEQVFPFVDATALRQTHAPAVLRVQVGGLPDEIEVRRVAPPEVLVTPGN